MNNFYEEVVLPFKREYRDKLKVIGYEIDPISISQTMGVISSILPFDTEYETEEQQKETKELIDSLSKWIDNNMEGYPDIPSTISNPLTKESFETLINLLGPEKRKEREKYTELMVDICKDIPDEKIEGYLLDNYKKDPNLNQNEKHLTVEEYEKIINEEFKGLDELNTI